MTHSMNSYVTWHSNWLFKRPVFCRFYQAFLVLTLLTAHGLSNAENWVVVQARGIAFKSGDVLDSATLLKLKEGEKLTAISPEGISVTLQGTYTGTISPTGNATSSDGKKALIALMANREARSKTVGVIRSGTSVSKLPDPWLIDVSYPGSRCIREATLPIWWRPETKQTIDFEVLPVDRSWSMAFHMDSGQDSLKVPPMLKFEGVSIFFMKYPAQEFAISLNGIPKTVENPLVLAAWMLEKGCQQQADALLEQLTAVTKGSR